MYKIDEEWKVIAEFPQYLISNYGRVKNSKNNHIMIGGYDKDGYRQVTFSVDKKQYNRRVCRLVAIAFVPNPNKFPVVNHKDEVKDNDYYKNLEWCTVLYNNNYGTKCNSMRKSVICVETNQIYKGLREAERQTGIFHANISRCCRNPNYTIKGFHWKYYNSGLNEEQ